MPQSDAYEEVSRRFTWRSSLLIALVVWIVIMVAVSEWMVARNNRNTPDDLDGPSVLPANQSQDGRAGNSFQPSQTPP